MFGRIASPVLVALLSWAAVQASEPRPAAQTPIPLPDGKNIRLQQYRGKVVVVAIFSMTCPDCVENIQMLNRVQKDTGPLGFQAIGVAGDDNARSQIGSFAERYKITIPIGYLNKEGMIAVGDIDKNRRPVAPIFLFIDKTGIVRLQYYGDDPFFKTAEGSTRSVIQALLKDKSK